MNRRKALLTSTLLAAGLFLSIAFLFVPPAPIPHPDSKGQPAPALEARAATGRPPRPRAAGRPVAAARRGLGFIPGDVLGWAFEQRRAIGLRAGDDGETADAAVDLDLTFDGILEARVYTRTTSGWLLGFELSEVSVTLTSSDTVPRERVELEKEMAGEVLASVGTLGGVDALVFPSSSSPEARNHWRDLLARWQVSLPEDASATSWDAYEVDPTGRYRARYEREQQKDESDERTVWLGKRKIEYVAVGQGPSADLGEFTTVEGLTRIRLDPLPATIEGAERIEMRPDALIDAVTTETVFVFRRIRQESSREVAAAGRRKAAHFQSAARTSVGSPDLAVDPVETTPPDLGSELEETRDVLVARGLQTSEAMERMQRVIDALRRDPQAADEVLRELRREGPGSDMSRLLLGALGAAGTVRAQEALEEIFTGSSWPEPKRSGALFAFAMVEDPRPEVDRALVQLHEEGGPLSTTALLVLAAAGNRARDRDTARFQTTSDYVLDALRAADLDPGKRIAALEALGNLGPDQTPPEVAAATQDPRPAVRTAAMHALQRVEDRLADQLLHRASLSDSADGVRAAAVDTLILSPREETTTVLQRIATEDSSDQVRERAAEGLRQLDSRWEIRSSHG